MAYNTTTKQWEIESEDEVLQRLITAYNSVVPNANLNINNIAGTGLHGLFYSYIHGYFDILQSGVVDLQGRMVFAIKEAQIQVLRPNVVKDNIKSYAKTQNLDLGVFDLNDSKLDGLQDGVYLVVKPNTNPQIQNQTLEFIAKNYIAAGVVMQGSTEFNTTLSNNQQIVVKYTIAEQLPLKLKIELKQKTNLDDPVVLTDSVKTSVYSYYKDNYSLGMDIDATDIFKLLTNQFNGISDIAVYTSLDDGLTWVVGSYVVAYDKFVDLTNNDIEVKVV